MRLDYSYDDQNDIFTIEGVRYSGELLRSGMQTRPSTLLRIVKNEDGVVVVHSYHVDIEDFERWHKRWCEKHAVYIPKDPDSGDYFPMPGETNG